MGATAGRTQTYRLTTSVQVAKFTALIGSAGNTTSTTGAIYAALPTGANQGPVKGVTFDHWLAPNTFYMEDTDPSTITGVTPPSPYQTFLGGTSQTDNGPALQIDGLARCYAGAGGTIHDGDVVVIADAYGRVQNAANLSIAGGTRIYPVGIARSEATATNTVLFVQLDFLPTTA
jgi:hypothetical protein